MTLFPLFCTHKILAENRFNHSTFHFKLTEIRSTGKIFFFCSQYKNSVSANTPVTLNGKLKKHAFSS